MGPPSRSVWGCVWTRGGVWAVATGVTMEPMSNQQNDPNGGEWPVYEPPTGSGSTGSGEPAPGYGQPGRSQNPYDIPGHPSGGQQGYAEPPGPHDTYGADTYGAAPGSYGSHPHGIQNPYGRGRYDQRDDFLMVGGRRKKPSTWWGTSLVPFALLALFLVLFVGGNSRFIWFVFVAYGLWIAFGRGRR